MPKKISILSKFLRWSDKTAGKPISFVIALVFLAIWILIGLFWGFTNTWLLILTAVATINASLMVFIIQNTQNRLSKALNIKLDFIISTVKETESQLIAIEELEEEEIDRLRKSLINNKKINSSKQ